MYEAKNVDTNLILDELLQMAHRAKERCSNEIARSEAFRDGYIKALDVVDDMFHCSNYEKCEVTSYANGGYDDDNDDHG